MKELDPPAVVRSAEDLKSLATEIDAACAAGDDWGRKTLEHYKAAGERLLKAKSQVPHGQFQEWIARNTRLSYDRAKRYMRIAKKGKMPLLEDGYQMLVDDVEDEPEQQDASQPVMCNRCARFGKPVNGCVACEEAKEAAAAEEKARKAAERARKAAERAKAEEGENPQEAGEAAPAATPEPLLCKRCKEKGALTNCPFCREARAKAAKPKGKKRPKSERPPVEFTWPLFHKTVARLKQLIEMCAVRHVIPREKIEPFEKEVWSVWDRLEELAYETEAQRAQEKAGTA